MQKKGEIPENLTYQQAWEELKKIEEEVAAQRVPIEDLSDVITRAKLLLDFCQNRLRKVEKNLNELFNDSSSD